MNSAGYLANPSRSAQIKARNAGALTNSEARSMGLRNYRDEMDDDEEFVGRPAHTRGNGRTYQSNGYTMNSAGYLANPSRSAQIKARNAGALTNSEARSMGLRNYRDEMDDDEEFVGRPAYTRGNGRTYQSNGYTMNSAGYLANPSRSAQIKARNAGALTNSEARSMGLRNYRDEMDDDGRPATRLEEHTNPMVHYELGRVANPSWSQSNSTTSLRVRSG